jgi:hypothetical protein
MTFLFGAGRSPATYIHKFDMKNTVSLVWHVNRRVDKEVN